MWVDIARNYVEFHNLAEKCQAMFVATEAACCEFSFEKNEIRKPLTFLKEQSFSPDWTNPDVLFR